MLHFAASDLVLHCLPLSVKRTLGLNGLSRMSNVAFSYIFSSEDFVGIYLSTNPSPRDPQNLLLA